MDRREFLRASSAAAFGFGLPAQVFAQTTRPTDSAWDAGILRHLLPQVSDSQMLIKASFANGDHVYWDLRSQNAVRTGASAEAQSIAGTFDRSDIVLGGDNETVLKRAAGPQIAPVYGTDFRSTPTFFIQDDHDYFDNDEPTDELLTSR